MQQTLRMVFRNAEDRIVSVNVADPDPEITEMAVDAVMDSILTKNVFMTTGGDLVSKVRAEIISREVNVLGEY